MYTLFPCTSQWCGQESRAPCRPRVSVSLCRCPCLCSQSCRSRSDMAGATWPRVLGLVVVCVLLSVASLVTLAVVQQNSQRCGTSLCVGANRKRRSGTISKRPARQLPANARERDRRYGMGSEARGKGIYGCLRRARVSETDRQTEKQRDRQSTRIFSGGAAVKHPARGGERMERTKLRPLSTTKLWGATSAGVSRWTGGNRSFPQ